MKTSLHNLEGAEGGDFARKADASSQFRKGSKHSHLNIGINPSNSL